MNESTTMSGGTSPARDRTFLGGLGVGTRIALLALLALALLAAFGALFAVGEGWLADARKQSVNALKVRALAAEVEAGILRMRQRERAFLLRKDIDSAAAYERDSSRVLATLAPLSGMAEEAKTHIDTINEGVLQLISQFKQVLEGEMALGLDQGKGLKGRLAAASRKLQSKVSKTGSDKLSAQLRAMRRSERNFMLTGDARHLDRITKRREDFDTLLARTPPDASPGIKASMDAYQATVKEFGEASLSQFGKIKRLGEIYSYMVPSLEALAEFAGQTGAQAEVRRLERSVGQIRLAGAVAAILLLALLGYPVWRSISLPLGAVTEAAQRIAVGEENVDLPGLGNADEMGRIARALSVLHHDGRGADADGLDRGAVGERLASDFEAILTEVINGVTEASTRLQFAAQAMSATTEQMNRRAFTASAAAEEAFSGVQAMLAVVLEISQAVSESSRALEGDEDRPEDAAENLGRASRKIAAAVKQIVDITDRIDLLALEATIQATRAGFAKAASENDRTAEQILDAVGQLSQRTRDLRQGVGAFLERARES
jgi:methyl-accepting chemotaxis protein